MKSFTILVAESIRSDEFKRFVRETNGLVQGELSAVYNDSVGSFLSLSLVDDLESEFDGNEIVEINSELGVEVKSVFVIHVGHHGQSEEYSSRVAGLVLDRWTGIRSSG